MSAIGQPARGFSNYFRDLLIVDIPHSNSQCSRMGITVNEIYRHPVKGLTPEPLEAVTLSAGEAIANDRRFALALGSTPIQGRLH